MIARSFAGTHAGAVARHCRDVAGRLVSAHARRRLRAVLALPRQKTLATLFIRENYSRQSLHYCRHINI